jgi:dihydrofolate reductase
MKGWMKEMRKLLVFDMITLDGFFEGPKHSLDWHNVDAEFNQFAIRQMDEVDTLIFGRATYEGMASYWQSDQAKKDDPAIAKRMNQIEKVVFSWTLDKANWNNTRLIKGDAAIEIVNLKRKQGKDMIIFGSARLTNSLLLMGLVDELRLIYNPVVLGEGVPFFKSIEEPMRLKLLRSKVFESGNLLVVYQPA